MGSLTPGYITSPANGAGTGNTIPLFSNLGVTQPSSGLTFLNASNNVRLDFQLSMAESRGLLKVLSRPRVVTQNNIQALVKQGVRVPIVTQAQLGGPPTVTYVDAFLRLTVTPQITSENTIFLNVDVENTTPDFGRTVQGNPTLITQQATTQVLVTDDADGFKTVADEVGVQHQVCKSHVLRNTQNLIERFQALIKSGEDASLKAIGVSVEQVQADLQRVARTDQEPQTGRSRGVGTDASSLSRSGTSRSRRTHEFGLSATDAVDFLAGIFGIV